jgi:hypothetical protein
LIFPYSSIFSHTKPFCSLCAGPSVIICGRWVPTQHAAYRFYDASRSSQIQEVDGTPFFMIRDVVLWRTFYFPHSFVGAEGCRQRTMTKVRFSS